MTKYLPGDFGLIRAYVRVVTFPPTSGDIGEALGIDDRKCTSILNEMLERGMLKRGSHRTSGYYLPEQEVPRYAITQKRGLR